MYVIYYVCLPVFHPNQLRDNFPFSLRYPSLFTIAKLSVEVFPHPLSQHSPPPFQPYNCFYSPQCFLLTATNRATEIEFSYAGYEQKCYKIGNENVLTITIRKGKWKETHAENE